MVPDCLTGSLCQICQWPLICMTLANFDRENGDMIADREWKVLEE